MFEGARQRGTGAGRGTSAAGMIGVLLTTSLAMGEGRTGALASSPASTLAPAPATAFVSGGRPGAFSTRAWLHSTSCRVHAEARAASCRRRHRDVARSDAGGAWGARGAWRAGESDASGGARGSLWGTWQSRASPVTVMSAVSAAAGAGPGIAGPPSVIGGAPATLSDNAVNAVKVGFFLVCSLFASVQSSILLLATKAVAKLVVSCTVGFVFTKKGILDQSAITALSRLIYFVFQPCLLFVNVASTIAAPGQDLRKLLVLPAFAVLQIVFGSIVGRAMEKVVGLKPGTSESRELRMCTSFANSGPLPLLFVDSIFGDHPDTSILSTAVAYISFYLLGWSPMFWTAGYTMVAGKPQAALPVSEAEEREFRQLSPFRKVMARWRRLNSNPTYKRIISPPVLSCIAGMVVALFPGGKELLLVRNAPLSPVLDALKSLGTAYLPAAILVLAGSLAKGQGTSEPSPEAPSSVRWEFYKKVGAIMFSRFAVMPFVAAGLLKCGRSAGVIPFDKLLWFILLMEGCMPSAQNSVVILQMEKKPELAASMAKTLTAVYLLSAVPIAVLLSVLLQLVKLT